MLWCFMIESWLFVLAMIAVLMIPGPTNALLASSAHQQGIAKTSLLIPAEFLVICMPLVCGRYSFI